MAKALKLDIDPKVLRLARTLETGRKTFNELKEPNKRLLLRSNVNLEGLVEEEELERYRLQIQAEQADSTVDRILANLRLRLGK